MNGFSRKSRTGCICVAYFSLIGGSRGKKSQILSRFSLTKKKKWGNLRTAARWIVPGHARSTLFSRVSADVSCSRKDRATNGLAGLALLDRGNVQTIRRKSRHHRRNWRAALVILCAIVALDTIVCGQIPCRYEVAAVIQAPPCPFTGSPPTFGTGISSNGRYVCGYYRQCDTGNKAFLFNTNTHVFTTLPLLTGVVSMQAEDVNDNGFVVGQMENSVAGQYQGFVWDSNVNLFTVLLPHPGGAWAGANAINNLNVVCGFRSIGSPTSQTTPFDAFTWSAATGFRSLGLIDGMSTSGYDINDAGQVAVNANPSAISSAYSWNVNQIQAVAPLLGSVQTFLRGINNKGQLAGVSVFAQGTPNQSFVWNAGYFDLIRHLPGYDLGGAVAVNDAGQTVGLLASSGSSPSRGFIWQSGIIREVNTLYSGPTYNVSRADAISNSGQIVADGVVSGHSLTILLDPIKVMGDADCNQIVNMDDLLSVIKAWGPCGGCATDFNGDNIVNIDDLIVVLQYWNS
jgi:uncharacterized membrane protein